MDGNPTTAEHTDRTAAPAADPMLPLPYRITRVRQELPDTFTLELVPADGSQRLSYRPGQFNMLYVFGTGEVPISVSGDPKNTKVLVHTTRAVGNVTKAMWRLKKDDAIGVRGPYGSHWPVDAAEARDVIIVAGGIGLAPLRPAMYHILANRGKYNKVVLLYGTRTPDDILYRPELERWRAKFDLEVHVTVDRATGDWHGNVGVVTTLIPKVPFDPTNACGMICGPEVMMRFTALELKKRGVPLDRVFVSMERNMKCAIGLCGHCQWGTKFVCKDGPVFPYSQVREMFGIWEL